MSFREFGEALAERLGAVCIAQDERFSSAAPQPVDVTRDEGPRGKSRAPGRRSSQRRRRERERSHATAAARILQRWLDARDSRRARELADSGTLMTGLSWRAAITVVLLIATMTAVASAVVVISRTSDPLRAADARIGSVGVEVNPASVTIVAGDSAAVIARRLLASQVIESDTRFELLALLFGWESRLEPGSYTFEAGLTTYEILRRIHFGETSPLRLVIPEGLRLEQVTERLAQAGVVDRAEFAAALATAAESTVAGTLAARRPAQTSLEGYLFPSAYSFPLGSTPDDALRLMLLRFDDMIDAAVVGTDHSVWSFAARDSDHRFDHRAGGCSGLGAHAGIGRDLEPAGGRHAVANELDRPVCGSASRARGGGRSCRMTI